MALITDPTLRSGLVYNHLQTEAPVFESNIPVIDISKYDNTKEFIDTVDKALKKGFFAVINSEMDLQVFENGYKIFHEFYSKPLEEQKMMCRPELNGQRGFIFSQENNGKANEKPDPKGFYHVGATDNIFPKDMEEPVMRLYEQLNKLSQPVLKAIALALGQREDFFTSSTEKGDKLMRSIHYYPNPKDGKWAAEHTDTGFLTLLPYASGEGLEVEIDGKWTMVQVPKNALVFNVADFLEIYSNGRYPSCNHRVRCTTPDVERESIVFFIHPTSETLVEPLIALDQKKTYPAGTRWEHLALRLFTINLLKEEQFAEVTKGRLVKRIEEMVNAGIAADSVKRWHESYVNRVREVSRQFTIARQL